MTKQWIRFGVALFLIGAGIGLFFRLPVRATPAGTSPAWPKSVFYTEKWLAAEGYMNTPSGYKQITDFEHDTEVSGEIREDSSGVPYAKTSPDLFVTKWRVNGHIHFQ